VIYQINVAFNDLRWKNLFLKKKTMKLNRKLNLEAYYPINDSKSLRSGVFSNLSESDIVKWRNFKIITKSDFIKNRLLDNQAKLCPLCSRTLVDKNTVVHHIDYRQLCNFQDVYRQNKPTEKKSFRTINVPKCDTCFSSENCLKKVILIHLRCHLILHKTEGRVQKTDKEKKAIIAKEREVSLKKEKWINSSREDLLNLIDILLIFINKSSSNTVFNLRYNRKYISLIPQNFIFFIPEKDNLVISVSLGNLSNWHRRLVQSKIDIKVRYRFKRVSRIYISLDLNTYHENQELILSIIKDAISTYDTGNDSNQLEFSF